MILVCIIFVAAKPHCFCFVFVHFNLRHEMFENLWKIVIAMSRSSLSLKYSVVSSVNCWILVTISRRSSRMGLFLICILLISLALILMARSSTPSTKSRGDRGHPWRMPHST